MKYIIILFALTCACGPVKETDTTAYVRLTKTCDSLKLAHNTLAYQVAENRYYDSMLIEDVRKEFRTDFHYVSENNELLNWRLERKFYQIDSVLYAKRESKLGRFIGTTIKYLR